MQGIMYRARSHYIGRLKGLREQLEGQSTVPFANYPGHESEASKVAHHEALIRNSMLSNFEHASFGPVASHSSCGMQRHHCLDVGLYAS